MHRSEVIVLAGKPYQVIRQSGGRIGVKRIPRNLQESVDYQIGDALKYALDGLPHPELVPDRTTKLLHQAIQSQVEKAMVQRYGASDGSQDT